MSTDVAEVAKRPRWDYARTGQAEMTHPRQADAVGNVSLVPLELFDLVRIHQRQGDAHIFEHLERGLPVLAGAFHQGGVHRIQLAQGTKLEGNALNTFVSVVVSGTVPGQNRRTGSSLVSATEHH